VICQGYLSCPDPDVFVHVIVPHLPQVFDKALDVLPDGGKVVVGKALLGAKLSDDGLNLKRKKIR
jgi:hypothetical protein